MPLGLGGCGEEGLDCHSLLGDGADELVEAFDLNGGWGHGGAESFGLNGEAGVSGVLVGDACFGSGSGFPFLAKGSGDFSRFVVERFHVGGGVSDELDVAAFAGALPADDVGSASGGDGVALKSGAVFDIEKAGDDKAGAHLPAVFRVFFHDFVFGGFDRVEVVGSGEAPAGH